MWNPSRTLAGQQCRLVSRLFFDFFVLSFLFSLQHTIPFTLASGLRRFLCSLHRRPRLACNLSLGFSATQTSLRSKLRVAVGTPVAQRPRTEPHKQVSCMRLLPRMLCVEAQAGIRMEDFGPGKPLFSELSQMLPRHPALLTTMLQDAQPAFAHLKPKALETGEVSR